jgi:3-hydroxybutyryl-CoA dehydrogenase
MARGIALVFAYAGHPVTILDVKDRDAGGYALAQSAAIGEVRGTLGALAELGLFQAAAIDPIARRITIAREAEAAGLLAHATVIFECLPEVLELKRQVLARLSPLAGEAPIIASTTSTILVDALAEALVHPQRFLNVHWLNPAYLIPLVEVSPGGKTDPAITRQVTALLEGIGKKPVVCAARAGYIVPRIQALAMNEAARLLEEGVASAEDIDKAVKYGFGFRYANLGLLEFIDWGGGDILYQASSYLSGALGSERYAAPPIVARNMREGNIGLKSGRGFFDYSNRDVEAYRVERLRGLVEMLDFLGLARPPVLDDGAPAAPPG